MMYAHSLEYQCGYDAMLKSAGLISSAKSAPGDAAALLKGYVKRNDGAVTSLGAVPNSFTDYSLSKSVLKNTSKEVDSNYDALQEVAGAYPFGPEVSKKHPELYGKWRESLAPYADEMDAVDNSRGVLKGHIQNAVKSAPGTLLGGAASAAKGYATRAVGVPGALKALPGSVEDFFLSRSFLKNIDTNIDSNYGALQEVAGAYPFGPEVSKKHPELYGKWRESLKDIESSVDYADSSEDALWAHAKTLAVGADITQMVVKGFPALSYLF